MPPAARLTDFHECPMCTPGVPPIPHVGGPILGPSVPNVLICGLPASVIGDMALCVAPEPDSVVAGSATVMIGGRPAARLGDATAHGGTIVLGAPTVMIGG
ncbi:MAG: PAAR domain-containing protein [Opitutae bacterium]|nr:PAAR domain-containing protein [Opitutae bacterium]